jgi:hypothetical protein
MRERQEITTEFEGLHETLKRPGVGFDEYKLDHHQRKRKTDALMLEVLLDIRDLLKYPATYVQYSPSSSVGGGPRMQ